MKKIIIIAGPTASGKTSTSVELAKMLNGEIICVDSMQIYKKMNIGTAKVTKNEMQGIPHHMIDIVEPFENFSVSDFVVLAKEKITDIISRGKMPILVGGTGLYYESLIYPFNLGGAKSDSIIKEKLYKELEQFGAEYLYNKLKEIDPLDAEKIHPNNTKRLIRALEIYELTGNTKSNFAQNKELQYDLEFFVLNWDREVLYSRIEKRVDIMFESGLENEIQQLLTDGITFDMQSMQGIGYKEFKEYFSGKINLQEVKNKIILNTRHYAKRQLTWFKRYNFAKFVSPEQLILMYKEKIGVNK